MATEREIEERNILQATLLAMSRAVGALRPRPDYLLVDAVLIPGLAIPQWPIVKGDQSSVSIAAASIVAKVIRDRLMEAHHRRHPEYNFRQNKGYGTAEHRRAIDRHGPCDLHRRTFRGVREHI